MDTSLFDYHLPPDRIAQQPMRPRDHSRLLVLQRRSGALEHRRFHEIQDYVREGDVLVVNDTKVFRARLTGTREDTGSPVDVLLLREEREGLWETLVKPGRRAKTGTRLSFAEGALRCQVAGRTDFGGRLLDFSITPGFDRRHFVEWLRECGQVPVPPYIKAPVTDEELYQTIYAEKEGSVAAPTAGFHFTEELLRKLEAQGVALARVTLHVGLGTFRPIKADRIEEHAMHEEYFSIDEAATRSMAEARRSGGRILAVGTTTVRALESSGGTDAAPGPASGWTSLFIRPGYQFRYVDAMITNFHLPRSTLLVLVCTFAGRETVLRAYHSAVEQGYRFYSFGDAMMIV